MVERGKNRDGGVGVVWIESMELGCRGDGGDGVGADRMGWGWEGWREWGGGGGGGAMMNRMGWGQRGEPVMGRAGWHQPTCPRLWVWGLCTVTPPCPVEVGALR